MENEKVVDEKKESLEFLELKSLNEKILEIKEEQEKRSDEYLSILEEISRNTDASEQNQELITAVTNNQLSDDVALTSYIADLSLIGAIFLVIPLVFVIKIGKKMYQTFLGHF